VLVADDQGFWRGALSDLLASRGHTVVCAADGQDALAQLRSDPAIDLMLTDWVMPGLAGPELCRRARELDRGRYLPIILLTSRSDREDLASALEAGADAFLRKPFAEAELLAQLRVAERVLLLEAGLGARIEELETARRRIDRDLSAAAEVQRALLPAEPPAIPGLACAWHFETCAQLGGDLFNVLALSPDHVGVYVLDVSGHGTSAALHAVSLAHALHPHAQQGGLLLGPEGPAGAGVPLAPSEVAAELNRRFPLIERSGQYVTFLYGVLELSSRRFRWVRAGHPPPIRLGPDGAAQCDGPAGIPIGVTADAAWRDGELVLRPGEGVLLVTDGALEARDPRGEAFGLPRLLEAAGRDGSIQTVVNGLRDALHGFRKHAPRRDDVTLAGLKLDA
jgi:sigma-B regulation protein RsbU (phosphoserine phosphatase)